MIKKLQGFLEKTFNVRASNGDIEKAISENNRKNDLVKKILEFSALPSPVIGWAEMHDVIFIFSTSFIADPSSSMLFCMDKRTCRHILNTIGINLLYTFKKRFYSCFNLSCVSLRIICYYF